MDTDKYGEVAEYVIRSMKRAAYVGFYYVLHGKISKFLPDNKYGIVAGVRLADNGNPLLFLSKSNRTIWIDNFNDYHKTWGDTREELQLSQHI